MIKQLLDFSASFAAISILTPLLVLIALLVKLRHLKILNTSDSNVSASGDENGIVRHFTSAPHRATRDS